MFADGLHKVQWVLCTALSLFETWIWLMCICLSVWGSVWRHNCPEPRWSLSSKDSHDHVQWHAAGHGSKEWTCCSGPVYTKTMWKRYDGKFAESIRYDRLRKAICSCLHEDDAGTFKDAFVWSESSFFCRVSASAKRHRSGVNWDTVRLKHIVIRRVFPNVSLSLSLLHLIYGETRSVRALVGKDVWCEVLPTY